MSPPEDWLEEDEMGAAGAFFSSSADFDESDESAPVTDEGAGTSLSPHVFNPQDEVEEEDDDAVAPLVAAGVVGTSSRWKTIAAVAAAVLLVVLFGQRLARRHAQAAASPPPVAALAPKGPAVDAPPEESPADVEDDLAMDDAKDGKSSSLGGGRGHAGPGSPPSDPAAPGGPSVARFPDLPREILNQLEQVFEAGSGQHSKGATDSIERYSH
jgi:hypothetical protein